MNFVVTDTGPLLHLYQIGAADLLGRLGIVHATSTVWRELQRHAPTFVGQPPPSWLKLCQPSGAALQMALQWVNAQILDAGEAEALAFALDSKADMFLTDDAAARTMAESLGLQARGSLGVVLYSAASGQLNHAASLQTLSDLEHRSTLWMSAKVRAAARSAISRIFGTP